MAIGPPAGENPSLCDAKTSAKRKATAGSGSKATNEYPKVNKRKEGEMAKQDEGNAQKPTKNKNKNAMGDKKIRTQRTLQPVQDIGEAIPAPYATKETLRELKAAEEIVEKNKTKADAEYDMDIKHATEYSDEIFEHLRFLENHLKPGAFCTIDRPQSYWKKRAVVMKWLVFVHDDWKLPHEVLFLAVNCFDRYLTREKVNDVDLMLFGATSLMIATKYENDDLGYLDLRDFEEYLVEKADGAFEDRSIQKLEPRMLQGLKYELGWPGPLNFLRRISRSDHYDIGTRTMSKYFLDVAVIDKRFVDCLPSFLSAGAYCLARSMQGNDCWVFSSPLSCWSRY